MARWLVLLSAFIAASAAPAPRARAPTPQPAALYSTALVDLIVALTQSRVTEAITAGIKACVDAELPPDSAIFADFQGLRPRERAADYVARTLLHAHPEAAGFVACMLTNNLASSEMLRRPENGGPLLAAAASLVGVTPDPTLLLSGLLFAGAPAGAASAGDRGYSLLHKLLSRDKIMLGDVASRLLQPLPEGGGAAAEAASHFALFLTAVAESVAVRLGGTTGEARRVRAAAKALAGAGSVLASASPAPAAVLGRRVAYGHLEALSNGLSQAALLVVLQHVRREHGGDGAGSGKSTGTVAGSAARPHAATARLILQRDALGRAPLHVAALNGNAGAVAMLLHELKAASASSAAPAEAGAGAEGGAPSALARALAQADAFGYTPRQLSVALGRAPVAALLATAEAAAGLDSVAASAGALPGTGRVGSSGIGSGSGSGSSDSAVGAPLEPGFLQGGHRELGPVVSVAVGARGKSVGAEAPEGGAEGAGEEEWLGEGVVEGAEEDEEAEEDDGGWVAPAFVPASARAAVAAAEAELGVCDFDVVDFSRCSAGRACTPTNATLPADEFLRRFVVPGRPVLLRGLASAEAWPVRAAWARAALLARHGAVELQAGAIPYASVFGRGSAKLSLAQHVHGLGRCTPAMARGDAPTPPGLGLDASVCALYAGAPAAPSAGGRADVRADAGRRAARSDSGDVGVDGAAEGAAEGEEAVGETFAYVFNRVGGPEDPAAALVADMTLLPWFLDVALPQTNGPAGNASSAAATGAAATAPLRLVQSRPEPPSPQFYAGPPGSGAPMHYHRDAFNVLAYGRKRWFVQPPPRAEYSTVPASDFVSDVLPRLRREAGKAGAPPPLPLQCTQRGGDVVFVPAGWGHAVLNLRTSVGYAVEWDSPLNSRY